jgi:hypothetical protein
MKIYLYIENVNILFLFDDLKTLIVFKNYDSHSSNGHNIAF